MAVDLFSWSTTAGSNTDINGIDIDENWAAANINNAIRDMMAQLALLRKLISGSITTGGSANAQTLASGFSMSSYQQDMPLSFEAGFTNTATATLDVDSIGAKTFNHNGQVLLPGDILAGSTYWCTYESDGDVIVLHNPARNPGDPVQPFCIRQCHCNIYSNLRHYFVGIRVRDEPADCIPQD